MTPQERPPTPTPPNTDLLLDNHTLSISIYSLSSSIYSLPPSIWSLPCPDCEYYYYNPSYNPDFPCESDYRFHPDPDFLYGPALPSTRYLRGRPATANPNPRGKHHRNPLPWSRRKLACIADYQSDADAYRRHLWEVEKKQQQQQQQQTRRNTTTPTNNKNKNKKKKTPPRPAAKPHFLTYLDAAARRHRVVGYRCWCCSWCDLVRLGPLQDWRREWPLLREQGRELARSGVWLPGEEVERVWEAEQEGDGEGGYGGGFGLADIVREEPGYVVRYKRGRARREVKGGVDGGKVPDVEVREVEQVEGGEEWEGEWDFVAVGDREGDVDGLGSEWTGVDGSTVGDAWEALSVDRG